MTSTEQAEEFKDTTEVNNLQTVIEKIYLFLISEAREYLPKFANLKFGEVDSVLRQVAANAKLDTTPALSQLAQEHIEEFLKTVIPQATADQIHDQLSVDKKEKMRILLSNSN